MQEEKTNSVRLALVLLRTFVRSNMETGELVPTVTTVETTYKISKTAAHNALKKLVEWRVIATDGTRGNRFCGQRQAREALKRRAIDLLEDSLSDLALISVRRSDLDAYVDEFFTAGVVA